MKCCNEGEKYGPTKQAKYSKNGGPSTGVLESAVNEMVVEKSKSELTDVLNENGVFTGRVESRKDVHRQGLWHRAIIVTLVNDDNKILIQKRAKTKEKFPGLWDLSVAGHLPFG